MIYRLGRIGFMAVGAALIVTQAAFGQTNPRLNRFIVEVKPGADPLAVLASHRLTARHVYTHALNGFAAEVPPGLVQALGNDPRVASVSIDQQVFAFGKPAKPPTKPPATYLDLRAVTEEVPAGVARVGARKVWETGAGIGVAILDTGIDFNHADLAPNLSSASFVSSAFGVPTAQDDAGHGTHVAGIVAAVEDRSGVLGVAPEATLYAVKVLDAGGSGSDSDIIAGLNWVLAQANLVSPKIRVINMSLGRPSSPFDSPLHTAVQNVVNAGISVVAAAGNEASIEVSRTVPAGFSEVIAVASTAAKPGNSDMSITIGADTASFFTTDGKFNTRTGVGVAISAPGETQEDISAGYIYSIGILSTGKGGEYVEMSGTSMAAPHAAGVVALLLEKSPTLGPAGVKARIMSGDREGTAPLDSPASSYTFDREREGILFAPIVLGY